MTDKKVSELDAITAVDDADFLPIVDDSETTGKNKKVTVSQLKSHITSGSTSLSYLADSSTSGVTAMSGHIIPTQNAQFDLGSAEYKIRHLYLDNNILHVGNSFISAKDNGDLDVQGLDSSSDVIVDNAEKGVVLKSPNGTFWRLTVDDGGNLMVEDIGTEKP